MSALDSLNLGKRIAPPRFVLFTLIFVVGLAIGIPTLGRAHGAMTAFDVAGTVFLVALIPLLRRDEADQMRAQSRANDANRVLLLGITGVTMLIILVSVAKELQGKGSMAGNALVIGTLALAWLFSNVVYALHYAHLYYKDDDGEDAGGIRVPGDDEPDYWAFLYFSFILGMTFQTADIEITSGIFRRVVIGHTLAAFVFNLGVIAFTINVLGGGG